MPNPTNAQILAAWLVHAKQSGENGRLTPTRDEIKSIIENEPPYYTEALAVASAMVKQIVSTEPRDLGEATIGFLHEVKRVQNGFNFLSAPPAARKVRR